MNLEFILIDRLNLVERPTRNNDPSSRPAASIVLLAMFSCALSSFCSSSFEGSNRSDFSLSSSCISSITTSFSFTIAVDHPSALSTGSNTLQLFQLPHLSQLCKGSEEVPLSWPLLFPGEQFFGELPLYMYQPKSVKFPHLQQLLMKAQLLMAKQGRYL